ncbi:hypothetical protein EKL30_01570 [Candidimonas sp. SYP-B2681]|uniref:hypothetical protein n=1 Tax=Candidimonas sp. SYP-B2681 TaxID=2497686 RepID=UPI000F88F440|nr:hypothetical protein [Candidimonas sp. SYP-B2681]RTZ47708.1 hypothetical protein EKL30_01570 [Candidimonas sp. SYP-B2681]
MTITLTPAQHAVLAFAIRAFRIELTTIGHFLDTKMEAADGIIEQLDEQIRRIQQKTLTLSAKQAVLYLDSEQERFRDLKAEYVRIGLEHKIEEFSLTQQLEEIDIVLGFLRHLTQNDYQNPDLASIPADQIKALLFSGSGITPKEEAFIPTRLLSKLIRRHRELGSNGSHVEQSSRPHE